MNLSDLKVEVKHLPDGYLGGRYLTSTYVTEHPSSLVISPGYLVGTPGLPATRTSMGFISPITDFVYHSSMGGKTAYFLLSNGVRALVLQGNSEEDVDLYIEKGKIRVEESTTVGKLTSEIEINNDQTFMTRGIAGDKLHISASVVNEHGDAFGRGGGGYVFGKKGVRTVFIEWYKEVRPPKVNTEHLPALVRKLMTDSAILKLRMGGTFGYLYEAVGEKGKLANESFNKSRLEKWFKHIKQGFQCMRCPIACKKLYDDKKAVEYFPYNTIKEHSSDLSDINEIYNLFNEYSFDAITAGALWNGSIEDLFSVSEEAIKKAFYTRLCLADDELYRSSVLRDPRKHLTQVGLLHILKNRREDTVLHHAVADILGLCVFSSYAFTLEDYNKLVGFPVTELAKDLLTRERSYKAQQCSPSS